MFKISYKFNDKIIDATFKEKFENENISINTVVNKKEIKASLLPKNEIEILKFNYTYSYEFEKNDNLFLNGYQSETDSIEVPIGHTMKGINHIPKFVLNKLSIEGYGDYSFKHYTRTQGRLHGYTYGYIKRDSEFYFIGSLNDRNGYLIVNFNTEKNKIVLESECEGLKICDEYTILYASIITGKEKSVFDKYFKALDIKRPKIPAKKGYTTQNTVDELGINISLDEMPKGKSSFNIFHIDCEYEKTVGDWLIVNGDRFPQGMKQLASNISQKGLLPGISIAPFVAEKASVIFIQHPEWFLKDKNKNMIYITKDKKELYILDIFNLQAKEYIKNILQTITQEWGYKLISLKLLFAVAIIPRGGKTRATIMFEAMDFIREILPTTAILACAVPLSAVFGKVEFCKIGCDVEHTWDGGLLSKKIYRERASTRMCMLNAIFRRQLDKRAFLNYTDVFFLKEEGIKLSVEQRANLCFISCLFGSLILVSDEINREEKQKAMLQEGLSLQHAAVTAVRSYRDIIEIVYMIDDIEYRKYINSKNGFNG